MEEFVKIMLQSGKSALDLALYVLLPVLVIMMAVMKLLDAKGVIAFVARLVQPLLRLFGIPGAGAFAIIQLLLVSFAAPVATLTIMEKDDTSRRQIAATLAMILTMSQANAVFPMVSVGLNLGVIILTSLLGGAVAASFTYYLFTRALKAEQSLDHDFVASSVKTGRANILTVMVSGGQEALQLILGAIPLLIIAIFAVNLLKAYGGISALQSLLAPLFSLAGVPAVAVLPLATKYLAGGTAMMGVTINLVKEGAITALEMNRMAGFIINPCDIVGISVLVSAGNRCSSIVRPAIAGAVIGIITRGVLHLLIF